MLLPPTHTPENNIRQRNWGVKYACTQAEGDPVDILHFEQSRWRGERLLEPLSAFSSQYSASLFVAIDFGCFKEQGLFAWRKEAIDIDPILN